jgi:hypothetical protein
MTYNDVRRFPVLWTATAQRDVLAIVARVVHVVVVSTRAPLVNDKTTLTRLPKRRWYT